MSESKSTSVQIGPGLAGCLTILFILLKVFGKIDWSWWWVFAPLWLGAAIFLAIMLFCLGVAFLVKLLD